jgi:hypothetical protein
VLVPVQAPIPSHVLTTTEPFKQAVGWQKLPAAYFWQPPLPSQRPLVPQLGVPWSVH